MNHLQSCISSHHLDHFAQDSFRKYDIDGNGDVPIDEFAFIVMESLETFAYDHTLINDIAKNIMPAGNKPVSELLLLIKSNEDASNPRKVEALMYLIEASLGGIISSSEEVFGENSEPVLTQDHLVDIVRSAFKQVIVELAYRFHFPRRKCLKLSVFNEESKDAEERLYSKSSIMKPLHSIWKRFRHPDVRDVRAESIGYSLDEYDNRSSLPVPQRDLADASDLVSASPAADFDICQLYILRHRSGDRQSRSGCSTKAADSLDRCRIDTEFFSILASVDRNKSQKIRYNPIDFPYDSSNVLIPQNISFYFFFNILQSYASFILSRRYSDKSIA
jgi:hypothetical protein